MEYGVQGSQDSTVKVITSGSVDSSAIKALLDLQAGSSHTIKVQGPRSVVFVKLKLMFLCYLSNLPFGLLFKQGWQYLVHICYVIN